MTHIEQLREQITNTLIANECALDHVTGGAPAAKEIPIPGTERVMYIGHRADVERLLATTAGEQAEPADVIAAAKLPPLPSQHEELHARWKCEDCDGRGHDGEPIWQGHFQPPEPSPCGTCAGSGCIPVEAYTPEQMAEYARAAIARTQGATQAAPASPEQVQAEPVAWLTADKRMMIFADVLKNNLDTSTEGMTPLYAGVPNSPKQVQAIPAGYKLVPIEPTHGMIGAGARAQLNADVGSQANSLKMAKVAYAAMLDAAPIAAAPAAEEVQDEARNQAQVDAIMDAIQHACGELPVGYEVILEMENGAGGVVWTDDEGEHHVIDGDGYISHDIHKAVERAIEHAAMKRAASTEGEAP